ncbi:MAG: phenylalanine--tRNA ligase subunit beta [Candidatus Kapaibacterium sp.]
MYVSYKWLKEFVDIKAAPKDLEKTLTMLGIEVEGIIDYQKKYENFFTAEVISSEKHPDADKLSICKVSLGDDKKLVVCGAPNVEAGQKVVLGTIGAVVPSGNFKLTKAKIRGVESEGMICSRTELETGDDASGIWVLPPETETGIPLAQYLGIDDIIYEVSLTPNKQDCLSHYGVARDLAAYYDIELKMPEVNLEESASAIENSLKISIKAPDKCPRYTARVIRDVKISESPEWIKRRLIAIGLRPVNAPVDITNYLMMEMGQPLHAFDLDTVEGNEIIIRTAKKGEKFTTLDHKERELDEEMLMICDAVKPVAIGGVMGGENSEISDKTKNILLESAYFHPATVRRTSKKLSIQSDSSYRFERGVDVNMVTFALDRAAKIIAEICGGKVEKGRIDEYPEALPVLKIRLRFDRAIKLIGVRVTPETIKEMLTRLGFVIVFEDDKSVDIEVPSHRSDVQYEADLIEEIARMYNYDNIEPDYSSKIDFGGGRIPEKLIQPSIRQNIREYLVNRGFNEIITQNMLDPVSGAMFTDNPVEIANPLGVELSLMRPSLVPAMLRTIERNIRMGSDSIALFEIGRSFSKSDSKDVFIPGYKERNELLIALCGNLYPLQWGRAARESDFYDIKGIFEDFADYMRYGSLKLSTIEKAEIVFSKNSLVVSHKKEKIGHIGEVNTKLLKHFDLENKVYLINIDLDKLYSIEPEEAKYSKVAPFPGIARDLSFIFESGFSAGDVINEILNKGGKFLKDVSIFDIYKGKSIGEGKISAAFSLYFASPEKTLAQEEIDKVIHKIVQSVEKKFNCSLRAN